MLCSSVRQSTIERNCESNVDQLVGNKFKGSTKHRWLFLVAEFRYVEMRQVGNGKGQISAYPRQLESLIRLSEAHAKVRLSDRVEEIDVNEAKR